MGIENMDIVPIGITPEAGLVAELIAVLDAQTIGDENVDYKKLYYYLFNGISDILDEAKTHLTAIQGLMDLQRCAEELFYRLSESAEESAEAV